MFRLSKGAEYAIRGLLYMASKPLDEVSYIGEITEARDIPTAYLAKLLQSLGRRGFVKSYRGRKGGFLLARPPGEITLLEIVEAIEGPIYLNECLIHKGLCQRDKVCPVHTVWRECLERFIDVLGSYNLAQMAEKEFILAQKRIKKT